MAKDQVNYPRPHQPTTAPANPGTQNVKQTSTVGYEGNRGKAATSTGENYNGGGRGGESVKAKK
jgi:hypothetical protein